MWDVSRGKQLMQLQALVGGFTTKPITALYTGKAFGRQFFALLFNAPILYRARRRQKFLVRTGFVRSSCRESAHADSRNIVYGKLNVNCENATDSRDAKLLTWFFLHRLPLFFAHGSFMASYKPYSASNALVWHDPTCPESIESGSFHNRRCECTVR